MLWIKNVFERKYLMGEKMKIYYREKYDGIEILRCFGIEGRVEIPGMIAFITELNTNYYSLWFIRENGSD